MHFWYRNLVPYFSKVAVYQGVPALLIPLFNNSLSHSGGGCGTQVMSIDSTLNSEHPSKAVAAGDNLGRIRLLRYPCTSPYADFKSYR